jgi:hypothetical protein
MNRKTFLQSVLRPLAAAPFALAAARLYAAGPAVEVYKTPTCGCCGNWVQHLKTNGLQVTVNEVPDTAPVRRQYGVPEKLQSCHTAVVGGYSIEGHVPAADIQRLLKEKPKAGGLAAPGMPAGSPGMDVPNSPAWDVLLFDAAGNTTVYHHYPAK